ACAGQIPAGLHIEGARTIDSDVEIKILTRLNDRDVAGLSILNPLRKIALKAVHLILVQEQCHVFTSLDPDRFRNLEERIREERVPGPHRVRNAAGYRIDVNRIGIAGMEDSLRMRLADTGKRKTISPPSRGVLLRERGDYRNQKRRKHRRLDESLRIQQSRVTRRICVTECGKNGDILIGEIISRSSRSWKLKIGSEIIIPGSHVRSASS